MIPLNLTLLTLFYFTKGYAISPLSLLSTVTLNIRVIDHQVCLVKRPDIGQVFFFPSAFEFPFSLSCFLISVFLLLFFCSFMISIVCYPFSFLLLLYASRSVYFLLLSVFSFPSSVQFFILLPVFCKLLFFPFPVLVLSACSISALSRNKSFTHIGHRTGALGGQGLLD